ncbi:MAG: methyltransferase [Alistipes sp.]|nr:methyltransferase [Alistipes sp.]
MRGKGFTFKQFHIDHSRCAMKVGTDGTLLGAWATLPDNGRILDIGTGTGLIAIMAAQRTSGAKITAIDIDEDCVLQAQENVAASPWPDRIEVIHSALQEFDTSEKFDVIISNPPYFIDSQLSPDAARSTARHTTTLPFNELVTGVRRLLANGGHFSLILPPTEMERFRSAARGVMFVVRECHVWSTPTSGVRRIMAEFHAEPPTELTVVEKIIIEEKGRHEYSKEYRTLTRDFYLKF